MISKREVNKGQILVAVSRIKVAKTNKKANQGRVDRKEKRLRQELQGLEQLLLVQHPQMMTKRTTNQQARPCRRQANRIRPRKRRRGSNNHRPWRPYTSILNRLTNAARNRRTRPGPQSASASTSSASAKNGSRSKIRKGSYRKNGALAWKKKSPESRPSVSWSYSYSISHRAYTSRRCRSFA